MQTYTGTKTVRAKPMTRGDYNTLRGWECPADENPADAGFLVEYVDGGKANHPDFAGYVSWSPADVFARAYKLAETWLDRLRNEHADLAERTAKLRAFVHSPAFAGLSFSDGELLVDQLEAMTRYLAILDERMALAAEGEAK